MKKNYKWLMLIGILIVCLFVYNSQLIKRGAVEADPAEATIEEPEKHVWQSEYTIFQYAQNGWTNHFFVTEFYEEDGYLFYKLKDHPEEYMLIRAEEFLPVPGWVEDIDELMKYGFWEPMESDW